MTDNYFVFKIILNLNSVIYYTWEMHKFGFIHCDPNVCENSFQKCMHNKWFYIAFFQFNFFTDA